LAILPVFCVNERYGPAPVLLILTSIVRLPCHIFLTLHIGICVHVDMFQASVYIVICVHVDMFQASVYSYLRSC